MILREIAQNQEEEQKNAQDRFNSNEEYKQGH